MASISCQKAHFLHTSRPRAVDVLFLFFINLQCNPVFSLFYIPSYRRNIKTPRVEMRAISSLRDIKMRVLVLSALFACAAAAPSFLAPVPLAAVAIPTIAVAPTIPPGDIQAAAINAQVQAVDQARSIADEAEERAMQAVENRNEGVVEANDLVKEKSEEAFWAAEEKKWQAMNEAQVAAAKIDGAVASNADVIAKSYALTGIVPVIPGIPAAGVIAPGVAIDSASSDDKATAVKSETVSEVKVESQPDVKSAEIEKQAEAEKPMEGEKKVEAAVEVKSAASEALKAESAALQQLKSVFPVPVAIAPGFNYQPYVAPITYQSALRAFPINAAYPYSAPIYSIKSVW
ncbi:unnamed protein product [Euphydryas editha]|uniref:Pupal cuticle protein PCP52 n=2 Tax=Euphydryas editha TaxID=104508 RepID=A0AAU9TDK2_EUPED|nr:unnamed protein product [Euphydryas editha]